MMRTAMRAVWYDRQGTADEVLVCGELPTPDAGHGEVRVRLEASGVNPSDTYRRRGPPAMEYPRVVTNSDGAGVDHIAEVDFGGNLAAALRCLRVNGSIMIYATNGDREPKLPVRELMQKNLTVCA